MTTNRVSTAAAHFSGRALLLRSERLLNALAVVLALLAVSAYLLTSLARIGYPFELEWMEGASVDTVLRILDGQPLYTQPSPDWVAPIYGPLAYYAAALVTPLTGIGFLPLRLLSFAASLACFAIIFVWVRRETRKVAPGLIAVGLFAASFDASGGWFDLARVDTLFLALLLLGIYGARFATTPRAAAVSGAVLSLAFLTKQTALVPALAIGLALLLVDWRRALAYGSALVLIIGGSTLLFNLASGGWYSYYVFGLGQENAYDLVRLMTFWTQDMQAFMILLALGLTLLASWMAHQRAADARFYALFLIGMLAAAYISRVRAGGDVNVLMPIHAALAILGGLALAYLVERLGRLPHEQRAPLKTALLAAFCLQLIALGYLPFNHWPSADDRAAGEAFIELLRAQPGEVLVIGHGYYAQMAGKVGSRIGWSMNVVGAGARDAARAGYLDSMRAAIADQRWSAIIVDQAIFLNEEYQDALDAYYTVEPITYDDDDTFQPVTGLPTRPIGIYRPGSGE